ncbi:MAG: hypothetical protein GY853_16325 [PVC group bacterium]|nr:hypothetical protein [PVC group bacterium]
MKTERIGLRVTKELKEALEKIAKEQSSSFSNYNLSYYIETVLIKHIENYDNKI